MISRAIETQSYTVGACQVGRHDQRESYGHSMVVDPWGRVVASAQQGECLLEADIDLSLVERTRVDMPVLEHQRLNIF